MGSSREDSATPLERQGESRRSSRGSALREPPPLDRRDESSPRARQRRGTLPRRQRVLGPTRTRAARARVSTAGSLQATESLFENQHWPSRGHLWIRRLASSSPSGARHGDSLACWTFPPFDP